MFPGIHAIAYALFNADEKLDRAAMRRQTEICLAAGVDGMAALGLATEVSKLREAERREIMDWTAEDVAGRVPLAFTIYGNSVAEQVAQIRHAESVKADWVILQPPNVGSYAGIEYIRFFGRIADQTTLARRDPECAGLHGPRPDGRGDPRPRRAASQCESS